MSKIREIIYICIIGVLLLTVAGMYYYPRPTPEPIVYTSSSGSDSIVADPTITGGTTDDSSDSGDTYVAPFITADKSSSKSASKPAPKPKKPSPTPGKVTASMGIKININTAGVGDLVRLPGIGAATAQKIIDYRNAHGDFTKIEDIMKVSGIGTAKYNAMKDLIEI